MDAIQVYALLNKKIKGLTSGIQSAIVNGTTITFNMYDGSSQTMTFSEPEDGVSVISMAIDADNHLICTMSDSTQIDAGVIPTITSEVETLVEEKVDEKVEEKVQEQIETQLDDTIQEKVNEAIENALGGEGGSDASADDEINSWFD